MATLYARKANGDGSTRFLVCAVPEYTPADELHNITHINGTYLPVTQATFIAELSRLACERGDGEAVAVYYTVGGVDRVTAGEMRDNAARVARYFEGTS